MTYLLWIDPGMSTGVALGRYSDTKPYELVKAWQIPGGLVGFRDFFRSGQLLEPDIGDESVVGCEKFTPRPNAKGGGLPLKVVEPMRIEGWLVGEEILPDYPVDGTPAPREWQHPPAQYFAGGKDQPEKKKRQHAWLKEHDFYVTGSMLGQPNADDARSAIAHSIAFMRKLEHMPTLKEHFS